MPAAFGRNGPVAVRVAVCAAVGIAGAVAAVVTGEARFAPAVGWTLAAALFAGWTWSIIAGMDAQRTGAHATREDPTRSLTDGIVLLAAIASLAGVIYLLAAGSAKGSSASIAAGVGITSVVSSWFVVHTVFTLRYALLYYTGKPGGVSFNQDDPPRYTDFAYLAFTLGMTYQVSDTDLQRHDFRATALRQALLSYLLGAVILAVVINLVAGLGTGS